MNWVDAVLSTLAGLTAAFINSAVGSGALAAFPVLLFQGLSPQKIVMALTVGLAPGTIAGAIGYREELRSLGSEAWKLVPASACGGALGAALLITMPMDAFNVVVPWLIGISVVLLLLQPRLRVLQVQRSLPPWLLHVLVLGLGVYGALLGAGQGILALVLLVIVGLNLQVANSVKNLVLASTNVVSAVIIILSAPINLLLCVCISLGAMIGGLGGSRVARRLPDAVLRTGVAVIAVMTILQMVLS